MENSLPAEPQPSPFPSNPLSPEETSVHATTEAHTQEVTQETAHPAQETGSAPEAAHSDADADEPVQAERTASEDAAQPAPEPGSLEDFAARCRTSRLSPEDEATATTLLQQTLLGGRTEVARAVAAIPSLSWVVSVKGTCNAWPEMKPSFRSQLLAGLAKTEGESAVRVRFSLARGLFKVDATAAVKLIMVTLKALRNKETGLLEGKGAAILANVLIGRGKAWLLQIPTAELKPAELDLLVQAGLHGAFYAPQAPLTQLTLLKWAASHERLEKISPDLQQLVLRAISRWSSKWQASLRREVSPLPEAWEEVLKSPKGPSQASPQGSEEGAEEQPEERNGGSREEAESTEETPANHERETDEEEDSEGDEEEEETEKKTRPQARQRPVYVSKTIPEQNGGGQAANQQHGRRGGLQGFNLQESLRQIEAYTSQLRSELAAAQKQLRQREDDSRRNRKPERPQPIPGELSAEELLRINQQLEARNSELTERIEELLADSEVRAASVGLVTDTPPPDPDTQLRSILGMKLREDFEDFLALEQQAKDLVVQQHYRTVLKHVLEVLCAEGIQFPPSDSAQA